MPGMGVMGVRNQYIFYFISQGSSPIFFYKLPGEFNMKAELRAARTFAEFVSKLCLLLDHSINSVRLFKLI